MLYNRLNISVTTRADVLAAIRSFLIADPGPAWVEDAQYTLANNPHDLFIKTSGATPGYVHFRSGDSLSLIHAGIAGIVEGDSGYGSGDGPDPAVLAITDSYGDRGVGLFAPDPTYEAVCKLHLVADNDRMVAILEQSPSGITTMMYVGFYKPHTAAINDTAPLIVASNSVNALLAAMSMPNLSARSLSFPSGIVKIDSNGMRRIVRLLDDGANNGGDFDTVPARETAIPFDDRAAGVEAFTYAMSVLMTQRGRGESIGLSNTSGTDGLLRISDNLKPGDTITVGASTYLVAALDVLYGSSVKCCAVGPLGDAI